MPALQQLRRWLTGGLSQWRQTARSRHMARKIKRARMLALEPALTESLGMSPGSMVQVATPALGMAAFLPFQGTSYVVKPATNGEDTAYPCTGGRWFVKGKPIEDLQYFSQSPGMNARADKGWLVEVGVMDCVELGVQGGPLFLGVTFRYLGYPGNSMMCRVMPTYPVGVNGLLDRPWQFQAVQNHNVRICEDIPVGIWFPRSDSGYQSADPLLIARSADAACVIYIRFQRGPMSGNVDEDAV